MPTPDDLLQAARGLQAALKEKRFVEPFRLVQIPSDPARIEETETGGYWLSIATIGQDRPDIEIWLDRVIDGQNAVYWAGFGASSERKIKKLVKDSNQSPRVTFKVGDTEEWEGIWRLIPAQAQRVASDPILELFGSVNGFGVYSRPGDILDVALSVNFISDVIWSLSETDDIVALVRDESLEPTERDQLIKARRGQGQFRADLEHIWGGKCAVLQTSTRELLRASHVKPWRDSNNSERLDGDNGILLSAHLDALFDKYLLTFDGDGQMKLSDSLLSQDVEKLQLKGMKLCKPPSDELREYLNFHRQRCFGET
jgi:hypothetical protein